MNARTQKDFSLECNELAEGRFSGRGFSPKGGAKKHGTVGEESLGEGKGFEPLTPEGVVFSGSMHGDMQ